MNQCICCDEWFHEACIGEVSFAQHHVYTYRTSLCRFCCFPCFLSHSFILLFIYPFIHSSFILHSFFIHSSFILHSFMCVSTLGILLWHFVLHFNVSICFSSPDVGFLVPRPPMLWLLTPPTPLFLVGSSPATRTSSFARLARRSRCFASSLQDTRRSTPVPWS